MIIRILSGKSFKGLGQYLVLDEKRVAWSQTRNLAHDDMPSAIHEMYQTYEDAPLLKEQAGIRGGQPLEKSVKHISLSWSPDQEPTKEQMIEAADGFLKHMKWDQHQAVFVAHDDKDHSHVHIMLNAVHPETGLKLDDSHERRRAERWGLEYERENGEVLCKQRLLDPEDREPAPTRETWLALKEAEREHAEQTRRTYDPAYLKKEDNRKVIEGEEWSILKAHQRETREAFFTEGKLVFRERLSEVAREVRDEFKPEWRQFFEAKRGGLDHDALGDMKADILERQRAVLDERRAEAAGDLRASRDDEYSLLLSGQKEMRDELRDRQADGLRSPHLLDRAYDPKAFPDIDRAAEQHPLQSLFRQTAEEVCERDADRGAFEPAMTFAENPRVKDPASSAGSLGLGLLGALSLINDRLLDSFFGDVPPNLERTAEPPKPKPAAVTERPNPFMPVAGAALQNVEADREQRRDHEYWDDRARGRRD